MLLVGDGAAVASCPMRRGGGFLPDAARRWRRAGGFGVICCRMYCARIARVGGPRYGSELAWIVEEVLLLGHF